LLFDAQFNTKYAYWGLADPAKLPADVEIVTSVNQFVAKAAKGTPVIDGVEDKVWEKAADININQFIQGKGAYGTAKALWDEKNLYVFVKVVDSKLSAVNINAYEQDSIEIFVDEKNDKAVDYQEDDAQYRISYENQFSSRGYPAKMTSVPVITKTGYNIEVMIPLQSIKGAEGVAIGFDLQINDDTGAGTRDAITKWNDSTNESFRNTSGFGTLIFGK